MALTLLQYEHLGALLSEVPGLVDALEDRRPGFTTDVVEWLRRVEGSLADNRLPAVSQVAACRAQLIEARRGILPAGIVVAGRPTSRKIQEATAAKVLERASDVLHGLLSEREGAFQEAERVSSQLLVVAGAKGIVAACEDGNAHPDMLRCVQRGLAADGDLAGGYAHLLALVGSTDVIIILDRALAKLS